MSQPEQNRGAEITPEAGDAQSLTIDRRTVVKGGVIAGAAAVITSKKTAVFAQSAGPRPRGATRHVQPAADEQSSDDAVRRQSSDTAAGNPDVLSPLPTKDAQTTPAGEAARDAHQALERIPAARLLSQHRGAFAAQVPPGSVADVSLDVQRPLPGPDVPRHLRRAVARSLPEQPADRSPGSGHPRDHGPHAQRPYAVGERRVRGRLLRLGPVERQSLPERLCRRRRSSAASATLARRCARSGTTITAPSSPPRTTISGLNGQFILYDSKDPGHELAGAGLAAAAGLLRRDGHPAAPARDPVLSDRQRPHRGIHPRGACQARSTSGSSTARSSRSSRFAAASTGSASSIPARPRSGTSVSSAPTVCRSR